MIRVRDARRWLVALGALTLQGCFAAGHDRYLTTRRLPKGQGNATVAVRGLGALGPAVERGVPRLSLGSPELHGRLGVARDVDVGVKAGGGFSSSSSYFLLGGDMKFRVVESGALSAAVAPLVQYAQSEERWRSDEGTLRSAYHHWLFDAPLVLGLELAPSVTLVLSPGALYALDVTVRPPFNRVLDSTRVSGFAPRLGLGLELWTDHRIAIHPELTAVLPLRDHGRRVVYTAGLGFRFGGGGPTP